MKTEVSISLPLQTFSISVPTKDVRLLSDISKRMGWTKSAVRKNRLDKAIDEVQRGEVTTYNSVDELMAAL